MLTLLILLGLVVTHVAVWVAGVAYTRRALRDNPDKFVENVLKAKALAASVRAKWEQVLDQLRH